MTTEVIKVTSHEVGAHAIARGCEILDRGGLIVFPTETVYGLAARADSQEAMARLREVKSRGPDKAFTVHIADSDDANRYAPDICGVAKRLAKKAWPGPLTIIAAVENNKPTPAMDELDSFTIEAIYHENSIGLRCPDDDTTRAILRQIDGPVVAASANLAGQPAPWTCDNVLSELDGQFDLMIDAGRTKYAKPSTIVRMTGSSYEIIREGVYDAGIVERLSMIRIMFVCTGNTCRSPMAEVMAQKMLADRMGCDPVDLEAAGIIVTSAGTSGGMGDATQHAVNVMKKRGLDLSQHHSTSLTSDMILQADYVFAMTQAHVERMVQMAPEAIDRVTLILDSQDVQDPIGGVEDQYEICAQSIEQGLELCLKEVTV